MLRTACFALIALLARSARALRSRAPLALSARALRSRTPLHSFLCLLARSLTHSRARGIVSDLMSQNDLVLSHSATPHLSAFADIYQRFLGVFLCVVRHILTSNFFCTYYISESSSVRLPHPCVDCHLCMRAGNSAGGLIHLYVCPCFKQFLISRIKNIGELII